MKSVRVRGMTSARTAFSYAANCVFSVASSGAASGMSYFLNSSSRPLAKNPTLPRSRSTCSLNGPSSSFCAEPLAHALHGELGERLEARLGAGVLAQARQRRPAPLLRHLIVEQRAQAVEDGLRRVDVRQQQLLADVEAVPLLPDRFDQDLEVLANQRDPSRRRDAVAVPAARGRGSRGARVARPALRSVIWSSNPSRPSWAAPSGASRACSWSTTRVCSLLRFTQSGAGAWVGVGLETTPAARQPCRRRSRAARRQQD